MAGHTLGDGLIQTELSVPAIHCGGCINKIETALGGIGGLDYVRVNLSTRRITLRWRETTSVRAALGALRSLGYEGHLFDSQTDAADKEFWHLIKALAVSAFASMNIMTLSVGVWSGAEGNTRDILHLISGAIALPTMIYSGQVFYKSAWNALRHGHANMDVPIAIGVLLAFFLSVYDTFTSAHHTYFDAVTSLLFFLLIGRTLDHLMRERARTAVRGLARLTARGALVVDEDGGRNYRPLEELLPGMTILLAAGERVPVDATVLDGTSDIDVSLVNGESEPLSVRPDVILQAGTLNLTAPLTIRANATARDSFLAEMMRMMEAAEAGRGTYRRIADRVSHYYAPVVHLAALIAFGAWMVIGGDLHQSITIAIAVLIITCPCALGLAVPMVHVVAARRLFENGIMLRDGSALERLAEIDTVVFDKTGTLTLGEPQLVEPQNLDPNALRIAGALAAYSRHPNSRAIEIAAKAVIPSGLVFETMNEYPGYGLEATMDGNVYRLGRANWALATDTDGLGTVLSRNGVLLAAFSFSDRLRPDAASAVAALTARELNLEVLSGDRHAIVSSLACDLGINRFGAEMLPGDKLARIGEIQAKGHKALMVGDGLNDSPALAAAHVSMAPANAADIGRSVSDFVFLRDSLRAVPVAHHTAKLAGKLVHQNLVLSLGYNVIALPIAVMGHVTPLVAALAMSASSILVVANALRLSLPERRRIP